MKTKNKYSKPEIEIIGMETEGIIAGSLDKVDETVEIARARRGFWEED